MQLPPGLFWVDSSTDGFPAIAKTLLDNHYAGPGQEYPILFPEAFLAIGDFSYGIARTRGEVTQLLGVIIATSRGDRASVIALCVHASARKKGFARALIAKLRVELAAAGIDTAEYYRANKMGSIEVYHRPIHVQFLIDVGFLSAGIVTTPARLIRMYPRGIIAPGVVRYTPECRKYVSHDRVHGLLTPSECVETLVRDGDGISAPDIISCYFFNNDTPSGRQIRNAFVWFVRGDVPVMLDSLSGWLNDRCDVISMVGGDFSKKSARLILGTGRLDSTRVIKDVSEPAGVIDFA